MQMIHWNPFFSAPQKQSSEVKWTGQVVVTGEVSEVQAHIVGVGGEEDRDVSINGHD